MVILAVFAGALSKAREVPAASVVGFVLAIARRGQRWIVLVGPKALVARALARGPECPAEAFRRCVGIALDRQGFPVPAVQLVSGVLNTHALKVRFDALVEPRIIALYVLLREPIVIGYVRSQLRVVLRLFVK